MKKCTPVFLVAVVCLFVFFTTACSSQGSVKAETQAQTETQPEVATQTEIQPEIQAELQTEPVAEQTEVETEVQGKPQEETAATETPPAGTQDEEQTEVETEVQGKPQEETAATETPPAVTQDKEQAKTGPEVQDKPQEKTAVAKTTVEPQPETQAETTVTPQTSETETPQTSETTQTSRLTDWDARQSRGGELYTYDESGFFSRDTILAAQAYACQYGDFSDIIINPFDYYIISESLIFFDMSGTIGLTGDGIQISTAVDTTTTPITRYWGVSVVVGHHTVVPYTKLYTMEEIYDFIDANIDKIMYISGKKYPK